MPHSRRGLWAGKLRAGMMRRERKGSRTLGQPQESEMELWAARLLLSTHTERRLWLISDEQIRNDEFLMTRSHLINPTRCLSGLLTGCFVAPRSQIAADMLPPRASHPAKIPRNPRASYL